MQIQHDVFIHFPHDKLEELAALLKLELAAIRKQLTNLKDIIMANQTDHTARLKAIAERAEKTKAEILEALAKVKETETTPEQDALLGRVEAAIGGLDDLNADAAPAPA